MPSGLRRAGAAALDLAWVAAGRLDAYWERDLGRWDVAAGVVEVPVVVPKEEPAVEAEAVAVEVDQVVEDLDVKHAVIVARITLFNIIVTPSRPGGCCREARRSRPL